MAYTATINLATRMFSDISLSLSLPSDHYEEPVRKELENLKLCTHRDGSGGVVTVHGVVY